MKDIYIYGAGGLGREIKAMLGQLPDWQLRGFYDDHMAKNSLCDGILCNGGGSELFNINQSIQLVLAFGDPRIKRRMATDLLRNSWIEFPTLVHPAASLLNASTITLEPGCVITAGAILTTDIRIGRHTLVNLNATVGHDVEIGEACSIMPGANISGRVVLEDSVLIGTGAAILNGLRIGRGARVGAGAVVTKSVRPGATVIGVPARELTPNELERI